MGHTKGYRSRTRDMFSQKFRHHGYINLKTYMKPVKVGDYVDIVANGSVHKGMPHKFYHGKTGVVFNITKSAIGVEVNKEIRNMVIKKRVHVRIEHIRNSNCRSEFLARVKKNTELKAAAKQNGTKVAVELLKRTPTLPKKGYFVSARAAGGVLPSVLGPQPFDEML